MPDYTPDTKGWIKTSAAYLDKAIGDLKQKSLAEALGLPFEGYVIFKDYVTHLEYVHSCEELWQKGLYVELHAYQHHVFMDWRFVDDEKWRDIYVALNGAAWSPCPRNGRSCLRVGMRD